jgi:glycosyltransferase involved in cell wall biosynthesis
MKLLIATPLYPPQLGGPSTYAKILEDHFPRIASDIYEADEIVLVKWSDYHGVKGIKHLRYFFGVLRAARSADAVLALDPVSVGFPAALAALVAKKPYLVKIVGDFAWEQGQQRFGITESLDAFARRGWTSVPVAFLRAIQTFVAHHATAIIVPSNYLKKIVTQWGIAPGKITVIYNSIELPEHAASSDQTGTAEKSTAVDVLTVGRLVPWKGIDGVIESVAEIRKKLPDATLAIIGEGSEKEHLQKKSAELLGDAGMFPGALSHEETLASMKRARIVVLNSTYEGLSHVLIEALMLGCAVVASDAGGNVELIQDDENGLLIQTGNTAALTEAITRLLTDTVLRVRLQRGALESSVRFSVPVMIESTRSLVQSIV